MVCRVCGFIVVVVVLVATSARVVAQSDNSPFEGVWAVQDVSYQDSGSGPSIHRPTGFIIFSGQHYSMVILENTSRPDLHPADVREASADQLRAVWGTFTANAGTFEVSGNTMTIRPTVAKMPIVMATGMFEEMSWTLDGDTVVFTTLRTKYGPIANPWTIRATRVK